ncbi:hypothetical protein EV699_1292 [Plasticicumulans lactativorans]|uniref:Uncharacterized protein n=1 Tax=Plasticicumulans lactativorans TaxID=1133106 RepID=A0A4R2KQH3_9GAMM|nr:hypothetical protein [Plasticicumulans lactativorans]TCO76521.1 hypothetical protein EV699_1292 [Plasticicumulans lactativorans]
MTDLTSLIALAAPATELAVKVLQQGADKLTAQVGADAAAAMLGAWSWLKGRLLPTPAAAAAVKDLEARPADPDNQADFRKQLRKALEADPALATELKQWLDRAGARGAVTTQTLTQTGIGNQGVQLSGHGNQVDIG